jgi:hypothetical protein
MISISQLKLRLSMFYDNSCATPLLPQIIGGILHKYYHCCGYSYHTYKFLELAVLINVHFDNFRKCIVYFFFRWKKTHLMERL